jgi:hypothetical protein
MACAVEDGFITTDVGEGGRNREGAIFRAPKIGHCLELKSSDLLHHAPLPPGDSGESCKPFFVGDKAFPRKKNLVRQYQRRFVRKIF